LVASLNFDGSKRTEGTNRSLNKLNIFEDTNPMDINSSTLLGFKYSENQVDISLSPPKGDRTVSFLRRVGDTFTWFRIPEPFHDSNKLYASFKGFPSGAWLELDLEDLGLPAAAFKVEGVQQEEVRLMDFVGSGWMKSADDANKAVVMVACGHSGKETWSISKLAHRSVNVEDVSACACDQKCDVIIPMVQPERVVSEKGVYFVG
jgi:hypothetical protein